MERGYKPKMVSYAPETNVYGSTFMGEYLNTRDFQSW